MRQQSPIETRDAVTFQRSRSTLEILGARMVTRINVHTEDTQMFSATAQNSRPGDLIHPYEQYWRILTWRQSGRNVRPKFHSHLMLKIESVELYVMSTIRESLPGDKAAET